MNKKDTTTSQTSTSDIILQPQNTTTSIEGAITTHFQKQQQQQLKRHTARSISECVDDDNDDDDIDYVDEQQQQDDNNANNVDNIDDDNDDDDFTTLSEMNEESQHTHASSSVLTSSVNIEFTTTKTNSAFINETISGHGVVKAIEKQPDRKVDAQNLLVNFSSSSDDEKSNQLYNTDDNESINSIESKAEISRGLVVEGSMSKAHESNENVDVNTNTKSNNDAFSSFFNNFNAGK